MADVRSDSTMRDVMRQDECRQEFADLYAAHEPQLYAYILAMMGDATAAEDVFQETCVVLWRKFSEFQVGTNFSAWARKIAYHMVMRHHEQAGRQHRLLSEGFIETVSALRAQRAGGRDRRAEALRGCLGKLNERDRELLTCRYGGDSRTIKDVADKLGRPANTAYKALRRIHGALLECVRRTLAQGDHE